MDFSRLPGFDIEADLAPLTALHNVTTSQQSTSPQQPQPNLANFLFSSTLQEFPNPQQQDPNVESEKKVFFITNCGSLLGRTIAQVALDRGHYVAACAREKHLADLNVLPSSPSLWDGY